MTGLPLRPAKYAALGLGLALLACIPLLNRSVGGMLPGPLNSSGSLQVLSLMFISAATALTLDVMFMRRDIIHGQVECGLQMLLQVREG